ncbi:MAG: TolC family protein [Planctomycetes bacterium]|nr:TolC family protein [Planctomycetota bacterium]
MVSRTSARLTPVGTILWVTLFTSFAAASTAIAEPGIRVKVALPAVVQTAQVGGGAADAEPISPQRLEWHLPDPELGRQTLVAQLARARESGDKDAAKRAARVLELIESIRRPKQIRLSLEDAIRRTLANNFTIQTLSYNPAIETTRVVEAESVFDAVVFANANNTKVDRPTASALVSNQASFLTANFGLRKLLATGAQVRGQYDFNREERDFAFQFLSPAYTSTFTLEVRQPLMRGFGLDFNRSLIVVANNNRRISDLEFRRTIRTTLRAVEQRYWRLAQARRNAVATARLLAEFEAILEILKARRGFDVRKAQLDTTKASLERIRALLIQEKTGIAGIAPGILTSQDELVAIMNDPEINLADDIEIIPVDFPTLQRFELDRLGEIQTALDSRTEIKEQELRIANAKIAVGRAANAELPGFDLVFRTESRGLAASADGSFDEVSRSNFIDYAIGLEFEVPIGNRGAKAASRRASLQHLQAVARLKTVLEDVILDVNHAVHALTTTHEQLGPLARSMEAREGEVSSASHRATGYDYNTLISILGAWQSLRGGRQDLFRRIVDYNLAIIDLERAKGTLLSYHGVVIP